MALKKEKGALTVEATLVFPVYIVAILTIVSFLNIFYTQTVMQQALNHTATLISQYTYAIGHKGDGLDFFVGVDEDFKHIGESLGRVGQSAQTALGSIADGIQISELPNVINNLGTFAGDVISLASDVGGINKEKIASVIVNALIGNVNEGIVSTIMESYLTDMQLNRAHITNLSYAGSKITSDGDIYIYASYTYENPFGIKFFDKIEIVQRSVARGWIGK